MNKLSETLFHMVCVKNYSIPKESENYTTYFTQGIDDATEFFNIRYEGRVDLNKKTVLDVGCGYGGTCVYLAQHGAKKVIGIDIDQLKVDFAHKELVSKYGHLIDIVSYKLPDEINADQFDIVLSFNSFEHYLDPESIMVLLKQYMQPNGILLIAFGPLWMSPWGGHIRFMTHFPWAHLLFPENVIMKERLRFRPEEKAQSFGQIRGGLNKMTLSRFNKIARDNNLSFDYYRTNVSCRRARILWRTMAKIPFCEEFFTLDVCTIARNKEIN